jgi:hypothetical protein
MAPKQGDVASLLATASKDLKQALRGLPGLRFKKPNRSWQTDTIGRYAVLATWGPERPQIELWLDKATHGQRHRFWFGFASDSEEKIRTLIDQLPNGLAPPRKPYTEDHWKRISPSSESFVLNAPREQVLTRPYWEAYKTFRAFYFGMYDWGGHAGPTALHLDTWRAATFITNVVASVSDEDAELTAFEGTSKKLFLLHRRREASLRRMKIRQAQLLNNGRLVCEVRNCNFDFEETYGEFGAGYAQVHHRKPLSEAGEGRKVKLTELAVVCANCHAMIHIGGECRPLDSLIAHKH